MHLGFPKFLKETMLLFLRSTTFLLCDVQEKFRTVIDQMYRELKWRTAKKKNGSLRKLTAFFFDGCGMLYMSIFHGVDLFHHDFMGFSCPTFVILLYYLELQVIVKLASGVNIEQKLENPYPNKRNVFSKHDDLFLQREIWKMDPLLWWRFSPMAELDA